MHRPIWPVVRQDKSAWNVVVLYSTKYIEHPSPIARDENVNRHGAKGTRAAPSKLQDIASKLSALAQQIKAIAAAPLTDTVDFDESREASRRGAIE